MKKKNSDFFSVLFNPGESACLAKSMYSVDVRPIAGADLGCGIYEFFSINPLKVGRKDANVTAFRNILIEIDCLPVEEQFAYIEKVGMPYSTAVFSGGKSIHFIISLEKPLPTRQEYDRLVKRIFRVVTKADPHTKNPSRLSRYPGHLRQAKRKEQTLHCVKGRVPNWLVEEWLMENGEPDSSENELLETKVEVPICAGGFGLSGFTKNFLMFGAKEGERNSSLFRAACNFKEAGFSIEDAIAKLGPVFLTGNSDAEGELNATVQSAYSRARA